ncbi:MAG: chemotaxis protein CheW [Kofleriaceae bacterium]
MFRIGDRLLALPITAVREIVDLQSITEVPASPAFVLGIASLRGSILSIIDTSSLLYDEKSPRPSTKILVLVREDVVLSGLSVDAVHGVVPLHRSETLLDQSATPTPFIGGHYDLGLGGLVAQIDLAAIYSHIDRQRTALNLEMT